MGLFGLGKPNVKKMKAKIDIKGLIKALSNKDSEICVEAINVLGKIGDKRAVEPLISALKDKEKFVREGAAEALGKIGEPAVEPLIGAMKDKEKFVQEGAAEVLVKIGEPAVESLVGALKDKRKVVREGAVKALEKIGEPAVEPLIGALKNKSKFVREGAADILAGIGWIPRNSTEEAYYLFAKMQWDKLMKLGKPAVEPLIGALKDKDKDVRRYIAEALGEIGEPAVEPLIGTMKDKEKFVQEGAAEVLVKIGEPAVESLIQKLKDKYIKKLAAEALGEIGDKRAVEPLIQALKDVDARWYVERALGEIGDKRAVEPLIQALRSKSNEDQRGAAKALVKIGEPAVELLIQQLKDKYTKTLAAEALGEIGDKRAVESLIRSLEDKAKGGSLIQTEAAEALGEIGDKRAVESLIRSLEDKAKGGSLIQTEAATALGKIGDKRAVEPLIKALKDKRALSGNVAKALGEIGDKRAVKPLIQALKDGDARWGAAAALGKIGDTRAVGPLIQALKDEKITFKPFAAIALIKIGDKRAAGPLFQALEYEHVQQTLATTDVKIGYSRRVDSLLQSWNDGDIIEFEKTLGKIGKMREMKDKREPDSEFFSEESTSDPTQALTILINKALKNLPVLSLEKFQEQYNIFRDSWGDLPLVEGSEDDIKDIILKNAKEISGRDDFDSFVIKLYGASDGYKDREAAVFETDLEKTGWLVMLWKTEEEIHAFGRSELLISKYEQEDIVDSKPAPKETYFHEENITMTDCCCICLEDMAGKPVMKDRVFGDVYCQKHAEYMKEMEFNHLKCNCGFRYYHSYGSYTDKRNCPKCGTIL